MNLVSTLCCFPISRSYLYWRIASSPCVYDFSQQSSHSSSLITFSLSSLILSSYSLARNCQVEEGRHVGLTGTDSSLERRRWSGNTIYLCLRYVPIYRSDLKKRPSLTHIVTWSCTLIDSRVARCLGRMEELRSGSFWVEHCNQACISIPHVGVSISSEYCLSDLQLDCW